MTRFKAAVLGVALTLTGFTAMTASAEASAVLIDQGNITYDPTSGLDWLDLTTTTNLEPHEILAGVGGYVTAGWHYATVDEVNGLFVDAGIPAISASSPGIWNYFTYGTAPDTAILSLIHLLGNTGGSGGSYRNFALGMLQGNTDGLLYFSQLGVYDTSTPQGNVGSSAQIYIDSFLFNNYPLATATGVGSRVTGSFLIRDHVDVPVAVTPLPAALPMFAAATGLMGFMGWKRQKNNAA